MHWATTPWPAQAIVLAELIVPTGWATTTPPSVEGFGGPAIGSELVVPNAWTEAQPAEASQQAWPITTHPGSTELVTPEGW